MKKSISVILMLAMLLSSVLAIIPMSAATEDTSNGIKVNFGDIPYLTLVDGKESAYDFISVYDVIPAGNSLATVANSNTPIEKTFNIGYVAQSEYAITSDSYYVYEFKAKLNRDTGYSGVVFAANGTEHYFAGGAFANDGDHRDAEGNQASHIRLFKSDWLGGPLDSEFGDHYKIPAFVEDGYGSWRVVYDGLTVNMQYLAKDGYWTYITHEDGSKASITLPEGSYVAFGAHNRGGAPGKERTVSIKDAVFYNGPVSDHPVDKTALDAYIKYVENTFFDSAKYEVSIWAAFENALAAARDVSAKEGVSQNVIDARLADLQNAVAVLKTYEEDTVYTDKTALYAYIEYVEKTFVYSVKYEASSWAELESALATAKDVSTQDNISQYDVDQALATLKYAVSALKINNFGNDVLLEGIVPEKVDFGSLTYKTLESGKESVYNFAEMYDVIIDGNSINTLANSKTSNDKALDLGYVAQTEYAIVEDSYYVYELKAKLNRKTGYACFVFAANGTEHYFVGGAFANDGDFNDAQGNQASHIHLHKNEWENYLFSEFGDHMTIPVLVDEDGYGSWRVIYDGLIIKMQYLAKDGTWTYITNDDGTLSCLKLPEGYYVAFGVHNRGGDLSRQRTINIRDAVFYDLTVYAPADKTALEEYIIYVESTYSDATMYDRASYKALMAALDAAKAAYADENLTQKAADIRINALQNAISNLKADMTELSSLIIECRNLAKIDYTEDSWVNFSAILDYARSNDATDIDTVRSIYESLLAAKNALVKVELDRTPIEEMLLVAYSLSEQDFGAYEWAKFMVAVDEAKNALDTVTLQSEINRAANALKEAIKVLNDSVLPSEDDLTRKLEDLKSYINKAETLNKANYTAISWYKLEKALNNAKRIYASDFKTEEEVEACARALENATACLEADTTKLDDLIFECEKLTNTDYTENTWRMFAAALEAAKANKSVDYEEVKALYDALAAARDALALFSADKTELKYLLTLASLFSEADFSVAEWASFAAKVAEAKIILNSEKATAPEVEAAVKKLKYAIEAINGGSLPTIPGEENSEENTADAPIEKPSEDPNETPIGKPSDNPGGEFGDDFGGDLGFEEPMFRDLGCTGVIGTSAVIVTVLLGAVALKKKED